MKYCPRCYRTEDQIGECPNEDFAGMKCPEPVEEDPSKTVTLSCGPCGLSRIVPVSALLSGRAKNELPTCRRDECACTIIPAPAPAPAPAPEPAPKKGKAAKPASAPEPAGEVAPAEAPQGDAPASDA